MARWLDNEETRELRGFALYVGLSASTARDHGVELGELVDSLKEELRSQVPTAESHALAVIAPIGTGSRDLDIVLQATVERTPPNEAVAAPEVDRIPRPGVVIDLARHRILVDGHDIAPTFKEFDLLQALVLTEGTTLSRTELRLAIANRDDEDTNDRTIDVHVRRLRQKFGEYADVIRTIHRKGYRFDPRSDVTVLRSSTPSPDRV